MFTWEKALQICGELKSQLSDDIVHIETLTKRYDHIDYMENIAWLSPFVLAPPLSAFIKHLQSHEMRELELIVEELKKKGWGNCSGNSIIIDDDSNDERGDGSQKKAETEENKIDSQKNSGDCIELKAPLDMFQPMELKLSESVDFEVSHEIIELDKLAEAEPMELPSHEPAVQASVATTIETTTPNEENLESPRAGQLVWAQMFKYPFWPATLKESPLTVIYWIKSNSSKNCMKSSRRHIDSIFLFVS